MLQIFDSSSIILSFRERYGHPYQQQQLNLSSLCKKVRRAQDMVVRTRPFTEKLHTIFDALISQLGVEDIWLPLLDIRKVKHVLLVSYAPLSFTSKSVMSLYH